MEELKRLMEKRGRFSRAEIDWLVAEGAKVGVMPPRNTRCVNCWRDMAIEIAYHVRKSQPTAKGWTLYGDAARDGVVFKGRLITDATLDDATRAWLEAEGFPVHLRKEAGDA